MRATSTSLARLPPIAPHERRLTNVAAVHQDSTFMESKRREAPYDPKRRDVESLRHRASSSYWLPTFDTRLAR